MMTSEPLPRTILQGLWMTPTMMPTGPQQWGMTPATMPTLAEEHYIYSNTYGWFIPQYIYSSPVNPFESFIGHHQPEIHQVKVKHVWAHNLWEEFKVIAAAATSRPFVTIDVEFPLLVQSSPKPFISREPEERYALLKANVDHLNLTHLGVTLADSFGNLAVWNFNFQDFNDQRHSRQKANLLALKEDGYNLATNTPQGINLRCFVDLMSSSGLMCGGSGRIWLAFSGSYDFGFLLKLLSGGKPLPDTLEGFMTSLKACFGNNIFDIKYLMKFCGFFPGLGLENLASKLKIKREVGEQHQAGSDSLLTWKVFEELGKRLSNMHDDWEDQLTSVLCGLHVP